MNYILVTRTYPHCANCTAAKRNLVRKGISFTEVDISEIDHNGLTIRTIPAVFSEKISNETFLGGIDYVRSL